MACKLYHLSHQQSNELLILILRAEFVLAFKDLFMAILLYPFYIIQQPIQLQNQNSTTHQLTSLKTQHRQPDQPFRISTRPIKPPTYLQNSVQIMP